ncbi:MAG: PQQ-binding-like beta-propeller repeat protein [Planctomycetota bacterium]
MTSFHLPRLSLAAAAMLAVAAISPMTTHGADAAATAQEILKATGVQGGLVVHLGCGDGKLTAALRANERYLVQGLACDPVQVEKARDTIRERGAYGPVTIDLFDGERLPYADNLVNLAVCDDLGKVGLKELYRVLAPEGVAYINENGSYTAKRKPRPTNIDEWTHFLYDASGNAVSSDEVVAPPRRMQWVAGPRSARGHEYLGSVSVVVSSGGRVFYIADEGPIASAALPADWQLVARDAYNGVLLWKQAIPKWEWHLRPFRSGPPQVHRRLVSVGDTVYATLGYGEPVTALDGATGEILRSFEGTAGAEEIVCHDGTLYVVIGRPSDQDKLNDAVRAEEPLPPVTRHIAALDARTGKLLWKTDEAAIPELFALTLAVHGGRAFYQTTTHVVALDATSGKELWRAPRPADLNRRAWASPTLVAMGDIVLSADQSAPQGDAAPGSSAPVDWEVTLSGGGKPGEIVAYAADSGKELWRGPCQQTYNAPPDVLVSDGLIWTGKLVQAKEAGITQGLDPQTGAVVRTRASDLDYFNPGMGHHRCYRNRATSRFLVMGRSGVEFIDVKTGDAEPNHWVRGTCQLGVVPGNGLLYVPPHTCGCFIKAKLNGFNVLAPATTTSGITDGGERLLRGPAYGQIVAGAATAADWPTYRSDAARSGAARSAAPQSLDPKWAATIGGKLTAPVIAEGKLLVAQVDTHTVYALDSATGTNLWSFTAGGRIDSPPTIDEGAAIFGSADGWVYCLRLSDGALAWRFRAAPGVRMVVSYDQLESAWPVCGSVLVLDGSVYCVAGRSSYLDEGMRLCRLDIRTGELLSETKLSGYDEATGQQIEAAVRPQGTEMPGALNDVLSSDGERIFLRHLAFDLEGREQAKSVPHLFSSVSLLDDTWWHRTYWIWGDNIRSGWGGWWQIGNMVPAGRLLVFNDQAIFGFGRSFYPHGNSGQWQIGEHYQFFAAPKQFQPAKPAAQPAGETKKGNKARPKKDGGAVTGKSIVPYKWQIPADIEARGLVLCGDTLFTAGPRGEGYRSLEAFRGEQGSALRAVSTRDGSTLAERELEAMPVLDGLAAAEGRLFLVTNQGDIVCFGK